MPTRAHQQYLGAM